MTDFFVSYTSADEAWAEWIAYVLEEEGYEVVLQAWDFRPGANFVLAMQEAAATADRTLMVLSPDYLSSQFASPEWAAAFADDPQGLAGKLVPVMVRECNPKGMLKPIIHVKLAGLDEKAARAALIGGIRSGRAKPPARPTFPGVAGQPEPKAFPGPGSTSVRQPYLPKVSRAPTDLERRRFLVESYKAIRRHFGEALPVLAEHVSGLEFDISDRDAQTFTAELFVNGKSVNVCKIWQGGMFNDNGISYAEGSTTISSNATNEVLSMSQGGELALSSLMGGFSYGRATEGLNWNE